MDWLDELKELILGLVDRMDGLQEENQQLQDRIEKLELCVRYPLREVTSTCAEPQLDVDLQPGQHIAKAIKAME